MDISDGACVRLAQGRFDAKTAYAEDPIRALARFQAAGAEFVHIVDLDGARDPSLCQISLLEALARSTALRIQMGGGVRSLGDVERLLALGAERVAVGTLAAESPELFVEMLNRFGGGALTLAADVLASEQQPLLRTRGWTANASKSLRELLDAFLARGLKRVLCTDISRDGMMGGPNVELYRGLAREFPGVEWQASGGVRSLGDLLALKEAFAHSAIVGRALYEDGLDLSEAVRSC